MTTTRKMCTTTSVSSAWPESVDAHGEPADLADRGSARLETSTNDIRGIRREGEKAEAAKKVGRWDSAQSNQLDDRCLIMVGSGPPMMDAAYNSNYHIVQSRDYVMILVEMIHDARLIPLDGRPAPPSNVRHWMGVSSGRWEGDTLVVPSDSMRSAGPKWGT